MKKKERDKAISNLTKFTATEAAYIAGFLDADGSIMLFWQKQAPRFKRKKYHIRLAVKFSNRNFTVMEWIFNRCGRLGCLSHIKNDLKNKKWSHAFEMSFATKVAGWILEQTIDYMLVKREQALIALQYLELSKKTRCGGRRGAILYEQNFPKYLELYECMKSLNRKGIYRISKKELGELLGTPNGNAEGNQQPSSQNVLSIVREKVQRSIGEDAQTNNPDTSAQHESEDMIRACGKP